MELGGGVDGVGDGVLVGVTVGGVQLHVGSAGQAGLRQAPNEQEYPLSH